MNGAGTTDYMREILDPYLTPCRRILNRLKT